KDQVLGWDDPLKRATTGAADEMDQTKAALAQLTQHVAATTPPVDVFSGSLTGATGALDRFTGSIDAAASRAVGGSASGTTASDVLATAQRYSGLSET